MKDHVATHPHHVLQEREAGGGRKRELLAVVTQAYKVSSTLKQEDWVFEARLSQKQNKVMAKRAPGLAMWPTS